MLMLPMVQFMEKKSSHWIGMEIHLTNNTITLFHCGLPNEDINVDIRQIEILQMLECLSLGLKNMSDINDDNAMDLLSMLCCEIFDQFMDRDFKEGVEVQAGKPLKVTPGYDSIVHISHASLGDCKGKKGEAVTLNVKEFELSHNWGKGSVHFFSLTFNVLCVFTEGGEDFSDSEEEEEVEVPVPVAANGNAAKAVANPKPVTAPDDSDSEGMDEDCSDDEDDSEEEEETPKAETRRKRAHEAAPAPKTPVSAKKAKAAEATPKKTEEKKKGGPATPHPAKKGGNTPATATQSPKSASQVSCGSCKKTFNSSNALESHTKAKHSATAK
ncbi:unnamed protein product [Brassica oleracea var. botrytis]|uniref:C2H2-type domain-containing protein n=3 Tax=Brassica TaxID=3705 RepID=A0A0D3A8I4_BRAOL|nr:unnamed protein product [Brassica napus]CDY20347.1 BnaC01g23930D [Brassica napus]VDD51004.1 unnamed protein product [Brassica oleracea]